MNTKGSSWRFVLPLAALACAPQPVVIATRPVTIVVASRPAQCAGEVERVLVEDSLRELTETETDDAGSITTEEGP